MEECGSRPSHKSEQLGQMQPQRSARSAPGARVCLQHLFVSYTSRLVKALLVGEAVRPCGQAISALPRRAEATGTVEATGTTTGKRGTNQAKGTSPPGTCNLYRDGNQGTETKGREPRSRNQGTGTRDGNPSSLEPSSATLTRWTVLLPKAFSLARKSYRPLRWDTRPRHPWELCHLGF